MCAGGREKKEGGWGRVLWDQRALMLHRGEKKNTLLAVDILKHFHSLTFGHKSGC